jgi:hypothetical protein
MNRFDLMPRFTLRDRLKVLEEKGPQTEDDYMLMYLVHKKVITNLDQESVPLGALYDITPAKVDLNPEKK